MERMFDRTIIKQNIKDILKNPVILFLLFLELLILIITAFELKIIYQEGKITYLKFFSEFTDAEIETLGYQLIISVYGLFSAGIIFFLILQSSAFLPEWLNGSILKLQLTRVNNRSKLFNSYFMGELIGVFLVLMTLGVGMTLVISFKAGSFFTLLPVYLCFLIYFVSISLFSLTLPISILSRNSLINSILCILVYFLLIPSLMFYFSDSEWGKYLLYLFPPALSELRVYNLSAETNVVYILMSIPYILIYLQLGSFLFKKMEIN